MHDQRFWPRLAHVLPSDALLLIDLGFTNVTYFAALTCTYITHAKSNLAFQLKRTLRCDAQVHDRLVWIGRGVIRQLVRPTPRTAATAGNPDHTGQPGPP